jgi:hypothetical protein
MFLQKGEQPEPFSVRRLFDATSIALSTPTLVLGVYWFLCRTSWRGHRAACD